MVQQWRRIVEVAARGRGDVASASTVAGDGSKGGRARERRGGGQRRASGYRLIAWWLHHGLRGLGEAEVDMMYGEDG
ncbi:hypothetical protein Syun_009341 [Stephania yunnanensis]|uniref:Uncharacterized protein n=1 Tax=Stephania yunnanensis TaxID=152371 RepID=A0AAP0KEG5_9MAGN